MEPQQLNHLLNQYPKKSLAEVLASYEHISLTPEEEMEAIILRKQRKEAELKRQADNERTRNNRLKLTGSQWTIEQTRDYMLYRAAKLYEGRFKLDNSNRPAYDLLCAYFSNDRSFIAMAANMGIKNPSLDKGLMLAGNFGVGKTWLMNLFAKNQRQVFEMRNAKFIADCFTSGGEESIEGFENKTLNALDDPSVFYQRYSGLCIDDLGTEDLKNHFGNKKNVIGDLIEKRYAKQTMGVFFHATTNLTSQQLNDFYGGRVVSRMRETLNFIEITGDDRRK